MAFLIIGIATAPFLVILDRGNTTGLLVAPLLGVAVAYMDGHQERMLILIIVCALLKPQMILLVLLFLVYRRYSYLVLAVAVSVGLTLAGFFLFPGSVLTNATNWFHLLRGYQDQATSSPYPYNLGVGQSVLTIFDLSHVESLTGEASRTELASRLSLHGNVLTVFIVVLTVVMLLLRGHQSNRLYPLLAVCILIAIAPQTSYSYYLALLLVPAAFVLRDPRDASASTQHRRRVGPESSTRIPCLDSRWDRVSRWSLILGLALVLTPLVIPISSIRFSTRTVKQGRGRSPAAPSGPTCSRCCSCPSRWRRADRRIPPLALNQQGEDVPTGPRTNLKNLALGTGVSDDVPRAASCRPAEYRGRETEFDRLVTGDLRSALADKRRASGGALESGADRGSSSASAIA